MDPEIKAEGFACLSESCADRNEGCLRTEAIPSSVSAKLGCFGIAVCVLIANICSLYRCEQTFAIQMFAFSAKLVYNDLRGQTESTTTTTPSQTTTPRLTSKTARDLHAKANPKPPETTTPKPPLGHREITTPKATTPISPDIKTNSMAPSQRTPSWQNLKPVKR